MVSGVTKALSSSPPATKSHPLLDEIDCFYFMFVKTSATTNAHAVPSFAVTLYSLYYIEQLIDQLDQL
jgi:hypothetical protein